jgi:uridine kinase
MIRDLYTRGHSLDATLQQWFYVRESEDVNIYPHKDNADYKIDSLAEYEMMVYKNLIYKELLKDKEKYANLIKCFAGIEEQSPDIVPEKSIISEFTKF